MTGGRWCTGGTCGGVRSGMCEASSTTPFSLSPLSHFFIDDDEKAKLPPPMSGWQEMTGMGWADIDLKVRIERERDVFSSLRTIVN